MPNLDGLEAARRILAADPAIRVLMLTTFDLDKYVYEALAAGASGFLLKDVTPSTWSPACGWSTPATRCWRRRSPGGWSRSSRPRAAARTATRRLAGALRRFTATWPR